MVVAYGQILPRSVIDIAPRGTINVHSSLLPRYRGAAPIHWAIVNGETETGVTTMMIDEGLDTGPILLKRATPIGPEETTPELEARLAALGGALLIETIDGLAPRHDHPDAPGPRGGDARPHPAQGRWADRLERARGGHRAARARPAAVAGDRDHMGGRRSQDPARATGGRNGGARSREPSSPMDDGLVVACGGGTALRILDVQPASRRPMTAGAFAAGARIASGARLG